jgi:DNA-binding Lrp family transcriptional regulator
MVDERDLIILNMLRKNARLSSRSLAKKLGLPVSTVHRRIKKLEKNGIITGYRASLNFEKLGRGVEVLVFVNIAEIELEARRVPIEEIKNEIKKLEDVVEIFSVEGKDFNLIVRARLKNIKQITPFVEKVRNIKGVEEASSTLVTSVS